jgi:hypothetical protein
MADDKPTAGDWQMVRHGDGSDYGPDAYTLWPQGIILKNLSEADARLIEAAPKLLAGLIEARQEWLVAYDTYVNDGDPAAVAALARMDAVLAAAGHDASQQPEGKHALPDTITLGWSVEDVHELRPDLSKEQCREVLHYVEEHHNASIGITWDTIEDAAEGLFPAPDSPPPASGQAVPGHPLPGDTVRPEPDPFTALWERSIGQLGIPLDDIPAAVGAIFPELAEKPSLGGAADAAPAKSRLRSPSEIAAAARNGGQGHDAGQDRNREHDREIEP